MTKRNAVIYLLRKDLRVSDNRIFHHLATTEDHGFTHLLPVYIFPPHQIELSGFLKDGQKYPYPEARSQVGRFWRTGPHRARFIAQSVWELKESLGKLSSGLVLRVGQYGQVLESLVDGLQERGYNIGAVWMTSEEGVEEKRDEGEVAATCSGAGIPFKIWTDEKYYIDDRDLPLDKPQDLPDVFTSYRKSVEPLRKQPRTPVSTPVKSSLPLYPPKDDIMPQTAPFIIPQSYEDLEEALVEPVKDFMSDMPSAPEQISSAHPFRGGESEARSRLQHLVLSGAVAKYKNTRNGLLGTDFSTKLSAYLAQGCITARQVHSTLVDYEDGKDDTYSKAPGYGEGENEGSGAVRFELLWRDYMRLCTRKFTYKLFRVTGFRDDDKVRWQSPGKGANGQAPQDNVSQTLQRVFTGTTGMGLIDASQRELIHTGYTSNRTRQNVASFISKHLEIDWRYGAEWYEMLLIDYDVSSNWANWQYVSGVGNDPRGENRIFNPVKQAFDYDKKGEYVRTWVPELKKLERLENLFQAWTTPREFWNACGLRGLSMAEDPVKKIEFSLEKPKSNKRPFDRRRRDGRVVSPTHLNSSEPGNHHAGTNNGGQPESFNPSRSRGGFRGRNNGSGGGMGMNAPNRGNGHSRGRGQQQHASAVQNAHQPNPMA